MPKRRARRTPRRSSSRRRGGRCRTRTCCPIATLRAASAAAAIATSRRWRGSSVLRAAELAGVPAVEVRTISNRPAESDRGAAGGSTTRSPARRDRAAAARGAALVRALTFGFSPCPNDTFAFHALVHGLVDAPFAVEPVLLDIEELNRRAHTGELDLTKLSFGAFAGGRRRATACCGAARRSAAASGRSSSRASERLARRGAGAIAIPGRETTAYLLLRLAEPELGEVVELRYDRILGAVERGRGRRGPDHPREPLHLRRPRPRRDRRPRRVVGGRDRAAGAAGRDLRPRRPRRRDRRRRRGGDPRLGRVRLRAPGGEPRRTSARTRRSCRTRSATRTSRCT